jgi:hypothetical protein
MAREIVASLQVLLGQILEASSGSGAAAEEETDRQQQRARSPPSYTR